MTGTRWLKAFVVIVLISIGHMSHAQTMSKADRDALQKKVYSLYPKNDQAAFEEAANRLKAASEAANDERTFYKTWSNIALYRAVHMQRNSALNIALEERAYAVAHNSKFGIYTSMYTLGVIQKMMDNRRQAWAALTEAIDYLHEHFPGESAAPALIELSKMLQAYGQANEAVEYAQKALKEPGLTPLHRLNAWSSICIAIADTSVYHPEGDYREEFSHAWAEREKAKAALGHDDSYRKVVEVWRLINNGEFDAALALCDSLGPKPSTESMKTVIYKRKGDFENAYYATQRLFKIKDSINAYRNSHLLMEMRADMDMGRMQLDAKELRLRNQQLRLEHVNDELRQEKMEKDAIDLALKHKESELANAAAKLRNDSLEASNKDLTISEYELKNAVLMSSERNRLITTSAATIILLLIIGGLAFFLHRRRLQMQKLKAAYDQLETVTTAHERINSELRIARDIQMSMLPHQFPDRPDLDLFAAMRAAKAVGGDLYDFFILDDRQLYFCVGDVSGKGVPASLFMAMTCRLFRSIAEEGRMPAEIATRLNDNLVKDNENSMFVTMFIGLIDLQTGHFDYCNAGHNAPVLIRRPQAPHPDATFMEMESNVPIGLWPDFRFEGEHIDNIANTPLFIYTDGLNEAEDEAQQQYGDDRLIESLRSQPFTTAREAINRAYAKARQFVGQAEQSDDVTSLCLLVKNVPAK